MELKERTKLIYYEMVNRACNECARPWEDINHIFRGVIQFYALEYAKLYQEIDKLKAKFDKYQQNP